MCVLPIVCTTNGSVICVLFAHKYCAVVLCIYPKLTVTSCLMLSNADGMQIEHINQAAAALL